MRTQRSRCAYCREMKNRLEMTQTPRCEKLLKKWSKVFGDEFAKRCQDRIYVFVCLCHFEDIVNGKRQLGAVPKPLPYCNENVGQRVVRRRQRRPLARNQTHVTDNNNSITPFQHCYICGKCCKDDQPTPGSTLTIFACRKHFSSPVLVGPFFNMDYMPNEFPIYPENDIEIELETK